MRLHLKEMGRGAAALVLIASILFAIACGPPKRETLERLASAGEQIASVIEANRSLPDQLFDQRLITEDVRQQLREGLRLAGETADAYNQGMRTVLSAKKPNLSVLVPTVSLLIQRFRALHIVNNEAWNKVLSGIEIGLSVVGTYFALQILAVRQKASELRVSEERVCSYLGVAYNPAVFSTILEYGASHTAKAAVGAS